MHHVTATRWDEPRSELRSGAENPRVSFADPVRFANVRFAAGGTW